jgi:sensor histidine kinase regulating citrate/malate metabolism
MFSSLLIGVFYMVKKGLYEEATLNQNPILMLVLIVLLMLYLILYFVSYHTCIYVVLQDETKRLSNLEEIMDGYFSQKQQSDQMVKIMSHDLKHNILLWKDIVQDKNNEKLLLSLEEYELELEKHSIVDVKNNIGNAIINQKLLQARKDLIHFQIKGLLYEDVLIRDIDLCSLLGNLMDNAIEASMKVEDPSSRWIQMHLKKENKRLFIEMKNSYAIAPEYKDNHFITHKKDKSLHGIGMKSINEILKKYDGVMENTYQENVFKTVIMLKAY